MDLRQLYSPAQTMTATNLAQFVQPFVNAVIVIAAVASFLSALFAGFRYVSSAGDVKQTQNATNMLTYSLIGLGIAVAAFVLTRILFEIGGAQGLF
jgi:hypothetical protein